MNIRYTPDTSNRFTGKAIDAMVRHVGIERAVADCIGAPPFSYEQSSSENAASEAGALLARLVSTLAEKGILTAPEVARICQLDVDPDAAVPYFVDDKGYIVRS